MAFSFGGNFGRSDAARQLFVWGVLAEVIRALGGPLFTEFQQIVNTIDPIEALSVADAVDAVIKGHLTADQGAFEAAKSGFDRQHFDVLTASAGEPPGLEFLLEAFRREFIPESGTGADSVSLEQGIRESRLKDKWIATVEQMRLRPIPPADAVEAVLKGQIPRDQGVKTAYFSGVSEDDFTILFNSAGNPPSPAELGILLKRGLIPREGVGPDQTSFQQGIFEGRSKDKWWTHYAELADYVPPPRTVTAMVRDGSLSDERALLFFKHAGMDDQTAAEFLASAHHQKTSAQRDLTVAEITALYRDKLIDHGEAVQMLKLLRLSDQDAAFVLDKADFDSLQAKVRQAVNKIHNLYVAHKIDAAAASAALDGLHVPAAGRDDLLTTWNLEREANVQVLTSAEIAEAARYGIIPVPEAVQRLVDIGWQRQEATIRVALAFRGRPPAAPGP